MHHSSIFSFSTNDLVCLLSLQSDLKMYCSNYCGLCFADCTITLAASRYGCHCSIEPLDYDLIFQDIAGYLGWQIFPDFVQTAAWWQPYRQDQQAEMWSHLRLQLVVLCGCCWAMLTEEECLCCKKFDRGQLLLEGHCRPHGSCVCDRPLKFWRTYG